MGAKKIEYLGVYEIAELAEVGSSAVGNWRKRHSVANMSSDPFPKPCAELASGPVFLKEDVVKWLIRNEKIN